ncbi:hypothetical protein C2845_PM08G30710 [Panicum miliaceum]|uniref:No apical meristem-associated C-terminal domain-containing protein n=1 Tax=Panicum miliaceum TaxID=4540 RepID=A0A3L6R600_PANMI|nr:hypothetical protein C2845_PM08G30710 [Panicum miliaceum]
MDPPSTSRPPDIVRPPPPPAPSRLHPSRLPPPPPLGPRPVLPGPPPRRQGRHAVASMGQERQTSDGLEQLVGAVASVAQKSKAQGAARKLQAARPSSAQHAPPPLSNLHVDATMPSQDAHNLFGTSNPMAAGGGFLADMLSDTISTEDFSVTMPYEPEGYEDESGFEVPTPTAKKVHSRSSNYTTQEDTALVMAWESITLDAVKGTDQTSSTYWMRIYDHYHRNKNCVSDRSLVSLQHRWGTIQECCNKWAGCMVQVERLHPSGVPYQEHINIAQERYKAKKPRLGKPFVMMHCWALLQHNQKWLTRNDEAPPKKQKSSNSFLEFEGAQDVEDGRVHDEDGRGRSPTPSSGGPSGNRPPGRKAEKEKLKRGVDGGVYKEVFQQMITKREEMEAHKKTRWMEIKAMEERKVAFEERKVAIKEEKLMVMREEAMNKKMEQEQKSCSWIQLALMMTKRHM